MFTSVEEVESVEIGKSSNKEVLELEIVLGESIRSIGVGI